jgi:hypothetical protein
MPSDLQNALSDAASELESFAGECFSVGSVRFKAWPVSNFSVAEGRIENIPSSSRFYEAIKSTTPDFERGAQLLAEESGRLVRVGEVRPPDPTSGLFRFELPAYPLA